MKSRDTSLFQKKQTQKLSSALGLLAAGCLFLVLALHFLGFPAVRAEKEPAATLSGRQFSPAPALSSGPARKNEEAKEWKLQKDPQLKGPAAAARQLPPGTAPEVIFLNDRAASVTGATPLAAPGFVRPEGLTGAGQVVAIADSGLGSGRMDDPHPDLKSRPGQKPKVIMLKSWAGRESADDPTGHGTHLAATVAGTGAASNGRFAGVAPGASIYFQAILNPEGKAAPPPDLTALFAPAYAASARIHLDGWGSEGNFYSAGAAQADAFIYQHPDFLVIFGAGNDGPEPGSLTNEANSKNALVVGASEGARPAFGPGEDNATEVARFSSRGPAADGRAKPDLVAPGSGIVSAASPLIKSNFEPNPLYTRMQGTSQAAAVTAGAAALLREYLQKEEKVPSPSAALVKAALINGARPLPGSGAGFGRLDLATTVIALKEKLFLYADERSPLSRDEERFYRYEVYTRTEPFVATLAWTDPPAEPGADKTLVNDLDLVVTAPDGKQYLGNDDSREGVKDDLNNVERVVIPHPLPGIYTVEVKAAGLTRGAQDFALVYGQPPVREVVSGYDADKNLIQFASGSKMAVPPVLKTALGRSLAPEKPRHIFPGEDAYIARGQNLYLAEEVWRAQATQNLPLAGGTLFLEARPDQREGGFYLHPRVTVLANGKQIASAAGLPAGAPAVGLINPSSQTIWWIKADFQLQEGILKEIDAADRRLFLFGSEQAYPLAAGAAFSFTDTAVDGSRADLPYGAPVAGTIDQLAPGMPAQLVISPQDRQVVYVGAKRTLAVGEIKEVNPAGEKITLGDPPGKDISYQLITGAPVTKDGQPARPAELKPGLHAALLLAGDTVIGVQADSLVTYGQVIYFESAKNRLYFLDCRNRMQTLAVAPEAAFFRWWQPGEPGSLLPGEWVRLTLDPRTGEVRRCDVADAEAEQSGLVDYYDPARRLAAFFPLGAGLVSACTNVTKNGYPVQIEDLLPGEKVEFTLLRVPKSEEKILAAAKGHPAAGVKAPFLQVSCRAQGDQITVEGTTAGEHIYIYSEDGQAVRIKPGADGRFTVALPRPAGKTLQVVTTERKSGGVAGMYVSIPEAAEPGPGAEAERKTGAEPGVSPGTEAGEGAGVSPGRGTLPGRGAGTRPGPDTGSETETKTGAGAEIGPAPGPGSKPAAFSDIAGHPAEKEITALAEKGILKGYPDGTYRPDRQVTRAEFTAMVIRVLGLKNGTETGGAVEFRDELPAWAAPDIRLAARYGLVGGYPDGAFYADRPLTGLEAICILARVAERTVNSTGGVSEGSTEERKRDGWSGIPSWAAVPAGQLSRSGLLPGYPDGRLYPYAGFTRAEAALIIYQLQKIIVR
ncbi:MAG: S8 family serine peptidase [Armatimonadetes bacterium]|nr:S8 family serine peptidase [Armatimonadota bacterium]